MSCAIILALLCFRDVASVEITPAGPIQGATIRIDASAVSLMLSEDDPLRFDWRQMNRACGEGACIFYHKHCEGDQSTFRCSYHLMRPNDPTGRSFEIAAHTRASIANAEASIRVLAEPGGGQISLMQLSAESSGTLPPLYETEDSSASRASLGIRSANAADRYVDNPIPVDFIRPPGRTASLGVSLVTDDHPPAPPHSADDQDGLPGASASSLALPPSIADGTELRRSSGACIRTTIAILGADPSRYAGRRVCVSGYFGQMIPYGETTAKLFATREQAARTYAQYYLELGIRLDAALQERISLYSTQLIRVRGVFEYDPRCWPRIDQREPDYTCSTHRPMSVRHAELRFSDGTLVGDEPAHSRDLHSREGAPARAADRVPRAPASDSDDRIPGNPAGTPHSPSRPHNQGEQPQRSGE